MFYKLNANISIKKKARVFMGFHLGILLFMLFMGFV